MITINKSIHSISFFSFLSIFVQKVADVLYYAFDKIFNSEKENNRCLGDYEVLTHDQSIILEENLYPDCRLRSKGHPKKKPNDDLSRNIYHFTSDKSKLLIFRRVR